MPGYGPEHTCVVGLGWGDEGKGKIVDLLAPDHDLVIRYNGGANAGHTVRVGGETFALHLVPGGVLHDGVTGLIGPGVVVDPAALLDEIDGLSARGVAITDNLRVSDRAHVVMPYHKIEDRLSEGAAAEDARIGTTARGIGPCYADKMRRAGAIRMCDLKSPNSELRERVRCLVRSRSACLRATYGDDGGLDAERVWEELEAAARRLEPFICDTTPYLRRALREEKRLLFEGANGTLLDIDHGTFPFVTSSSTGPYGVSAGAGVPLGIVRRIVGVIKAYSTRVGAGPFVTELNDATGETIRRRGNEYGTTTGRPRRCGWFDAVATRYSTWLGGVTEIALMHLDTLSGFPQVGVCVGYELDGQAVEGPMADVKALARIRPVYEWMPGWSGEMRHLTGFDDLPGPAQAYVRRIETLVGARVMMVGVGPERSEVVLRAMHD